MSKRVLAKAEGRRQKENNRAAGDVAVLTRVTTATKSPGPGGGVLPVEVVQNAVELGVALAQGNRTLEKTFGRHGEELRSAGGAVLIQKRGPPLPRLTHKPVIFGIDHPLPAALLVSLQGRRSVHVSVEIVEMMSKLVKD